MCHVVANSDEHHWHPLGYVVLGLPIRCSGIGTMRLVSRGGACLRAGPDSGPTDISRPAIVIGALGPMEKSEHQIEQQD